MEPDVKVLSSERVTEPRHASNRVAVSVPQQAKRRLRQFWAII